MIKSKIFFSALLIAFLIAGCSSPAQNSASGISASSEESGDAPTSGVHTISVSGTGTVSMVADMARITIGVETDGAVAAEAVAANNLQSELVLTVLSEIGVESRDVRTTNFSVFPIQIRNSRGIVTGTTFRVQNTVNVTVRNLADLGAILDEVVTAGANTISGITFMLNDVAERSAKDEALADAMSDARRQADLLAAAAGVVVVDVVSINVSAIGGPISFVETRAIGAGAAGDVPIAVGEMELTYQVFVVFEVVASGGSEPAEAASPDEESSDE